MSTSNSEYEEALEGLTRAIAQLVGMGNPSLATHVWTQLKNLELEYPEGSKARLALRAAQDRAAEAAAATGQ